MKAVRPPLAGQRRLIKAVRFLLIAAAAFLLSSCATEASLVARRYRLHSPKIKPGPTLTFAVLSDTHSQVFENDGKRIVEMLAGAAPDLIFLVGDIIDNVLPMTGSEILLGNIERLAPIYFVPGNHEYYNRNMEEVFALVRSHGIAILQDSHVEVEVRGNAVIIAGVEDSARARFHDPQYDWEAGAREAFAPLAGRSEYKILLSHRPDHAAVFAGYGFDLMLSGHTHGGQIRLFPFTNGVYAPGQGLFPKLSGGQYRIGAMNLVISRGVTTTRPNLPRINNPPEVVLIELTSSN
ncbi:MAG: metallophosphoesterase [Spirochaetaceae bacterium]|jgi:predicted MPP superfamily phosphohydrolase|nr:metallophosphoesterase [Spirochaetaceae bacterium]